MPAPGFSRRSSALESENGASAEGVPSPTMQILQIILAIILPPVGVALKAGVGKDFVINLILTLLFFVPGVIHALWVVLRK